MERIREVVPRGVRFAYDTSGVAGSWAAAAQCIAMGGTFANVAVPPAELDFPFIELLSKGARFQFILAGSSIPRVFLPQMIHWYKQGRFPFDRLVKPFPFAEINKAFEESAAGRAIKPVLVMP